MAQTLDSQGNVVQNGFSTNQTPAQFASANIPTAISASSLATPQSPIPVTQPNYNTPTQATQAAQAGAYINNGSITAQQQAEQIAKQNEISLTNEKNQLNTTLGALQASTGSKGTDILNAYNQQDASGNSVNSLAAKLRGFSAQSQALSLDNLAKQEAEINKATGQNITQSAVSRNTADATRNNLIQQATIAMQSAIVSADYNSAKSYADQIVEAKYSQKLADIEAAKTNIANIQDQLTAAEKKTAQATLEKLNNDKQVYDAKIANEKTISDALVKVGTYRDLNGNPAPQSVIDKIKNATDPLTATLLSLPYINDPLERQKKLEDMANARAKASSTGVTSASLAKNMPNQALIDSINNGEIDPNKVNSRTIGIMNTLASAKVDAVGSSAGSQARTAAVKTIYGQVSQARRVTAVLDKNMPLLYDLADKVNTTNTPGIDRIIAGAQTYTGNNPDVIRYVNTIKTIRSEYAQMLARGGEVTESQRADAADAIPTGLSGQGYKEIGAQLQLETKNIIDAGNETYSAVLNPKSVPTHSGYTLPSASAGSYKGYSLPH